ncbi:MAG: DUF7289 family protein [Halodesulfurarchaeum sp.]
MSTITPKSSDTRAVSDTLAFVITFSIIVASVGLVYGVGFGSLMDIRDGQQGVNAQQTFEVLGEGIGEIRDGGATSSSGRIELREGTLAVNTTSSVTVTINGSETVYNGALGALTYRVDETTTMGYEGGASFGRYQTNSVMDTAPQFQCGSDSNSDTTVISLVVLEPQGPSVGSSGTVGITASKKNASLVFPERTTAEPDVDEVSVTISDSQFQEAWNREFEDRSEWSRSGNTYTCDTERVFVRVTVVEIEFET